MVLDLTTQLAPVMWGMIVLMALSTVSLLASHK
jgi:hypothetical protein